VKLEKSTRGVRLVDFQDLLRYLNSLSDRSPIQGTDKAKAGPAARRLKREEGAAKRIISIQTSRGSEAAVERNGTDCTGKQMR